MAGCNFKNDSLRAQGTIMKGIAYVTDNGSMKMKVKSSYPDSFGCGVHALESSGNYLYPECTSSSSSSSSSSGGAGVWDQSTWDNSVFGD